MLSFVIWHAEPQIPKETSPKRCEITVLNEIGSITKALQVFSVSSSFLYHTLSADY